MLVGHAHYVAVQEFNQEYDRVKEKLEEERRLNVAAHGGWGWGRGMASSGRPVSCGQRRGVRRLS